VTGSVDWLSVPDLLMRGIGNARLRHGDWWDYYMKLEIGADGTQSTGGTHNDHRPAVVPTTCVCRVTAISLRPGSKRWINCESYLQSCVPANIEFRMFQGDDANACKHLLPDVGAVEEALGTHVYRDWPICETADLQRVFSREMEGLSDLQAWTCYRRMFRSLWKQQEAEDYIDGYARQTTLGEIGRSLSHLKVMEQAMVDAIEVQIIFEDDARPSEKAIEVLMAEVDLLKSLGKSWDLIYIRSKKYDWCDEPLFVEGSSLLLASHRKATDAYAVSRQGMEKISGSGFRDCLFALEDFLPALYSRHPRIDIEGLPCVEKVRAQGFVALCFPRTEDGDNEFCRNLCLLSETHATRSLPLIGDAGMFE